MNIEKKDNFTLVSPTEKSVEEFLKNFNNNIKSTDKEHIVINFSENFNIDSEKIDLFLNTANDFRENGTSFVLIITGIDIDAIPDEINVVPTFPEAIDILEMDAIERDLLDF